MNELGSFVTRVFTAWKQAQIPFVVLRNYEGLPEETGNDIDVLVAAENYKAATEQLNTAAQETGFTLFNKITASGISALYYKSEYQQVHFDLTVGPRWRFVPLLSAQTVLEQRCEAELFDTPQPLHEATINLLYNLLLQGKVKDKYKAAIQTVFSREEARAKSLLEPRFGALMAGQIVEAAQQAKWSALEAKTTALRRTLLMRQAGSAPLGTLQLGADYLRQLAKRLTRPPGLVVAFIGPDGSGKSTVAAGLAETLKADFVSYKYVHWKPSVLTRKKGENSAPVTDPHAQPVRGKPLSLLYFIFHLTDFALGGALYLRPQAFKKSLVFIDRYYYDFFVDLKRFRLVIPDSLVELGYQFIVKPDLIFYLDAAPEIYQSRKQEVSFEETKRQRDAYLALAKRLPQAKILDAAKPLNEVIQDAKHAALGFLVERAKKS